MSMDLASNAPQPRLCNIQKKYPEQEYGFNLHAEKEKGQFIGNVDEASPAHTAGLKSGDRIIGVNGVLIAEESHRNVVGRIKENPLCCKLLVIEDGGEAWYKGRRIPITFDLPNIIYCDPDSQGKERRPQHSPHTSPPPPATLPPSYDSVPVPDPQLPPTHNTPSPMQTPKLSPQPHSPMVNGVKPRPRLCTLRKRTQLDEYGFNLHAERGKGHFIGHVDGNSLAEVAGLEEGQRIVGVNGTLIYPATPHKEVVTLIKKDSMIAELLVASPEVDEWYRSHGVEFSFEDAEIIRVPSPAAHAKPHSPVPVSIPTVPASFPSPTYSNGTGRGTDRSHGSEGESSAGTGRLSTVDTASPASQKRNGNDVTVISVVPTPQEPRDAPSPEPPTHHNVSNGHHHQAQSSPPSTPSPVPYRHSPQMDHSPSSNRNSNTLSQNSGGYEPSNNGVQQQRHEGHNMEPLFKMTAAQMREQLSRKKKHDPKKDPLSLQEKYEIIRNL